LSRLATLLFVSLSLAPLTAQAQQCAATLFGDGVCDCGCGTADPDCGAGATFANCVRSHCTAGKVPWEHTPSTCMTSACGDGWKDPAAGEACDDGNALASGGCSASCGAVSSGYVCGEGAAGCHLAPIDAGSPTPDAGSTVDAGTDAGLGAGGGAGAAGGGSGADAGTDPAPQQGGCSTVPASTLIGALALWLTTARRRS
jgi:cysteine-rich repeat protein